MSGSSMQYDKNKISGIRDLVYRDKIGRKESIERGMNIYFSKKQCNCGGYIRYISNSDCVACSKGRRKKPARDKSINNEKVSARRSIEDIKEQSENDYWDSLLDE